MGTRDRGSFHAWGIALAVVLAQSGAKGDEPPPSVQQLRSAAAEYDAGRRAYVDKDYDGAAAHFENAFHDAPSAEALRNAIRAHQRAGHLSRAATLAEVALQRYPRDAATGAIVAKVLAESQVKLHKLILTCSPECGVAADGRAISLSDATQTTFFLDPGAHDLAVSWSSDRTKVEKFTARAGGRDEISLEAPPVPAAPVPVVPAPVIAASRPQVDLIAEAPHKPFGPAVFIGLAAVTAGGIAFTAWSGVDAENNPGAQAVMQGCVGQGTSCPLYQKGLAAQLRTNIALGATGAVALTTALVGIFFTQWTTPKPRSTPLALAPTGVVMPGGGALGLEGSF